MRLRIPRCTNLAVLFNISQNAFDPRPLPFEHLVENFKPLPGNLLGYYEQFFLNMGLGIPTPPPLFRKYS